MSEHPTDDVNAAREAWQEFCQSLERAADPILADGTDVAEGLRYVTRMAVLQLQGTMENVDAARPEMGWVHPSKMGQDNPDGFYQTAPFEGSRTYRLHGNVGRVQYLGIAAMTWSFGGDPIVVMFNVNADELPTDADGNFSVTISPNPRPGDVPEGQWITVTQPKRGRLIVRQFLYDWEQEEPATLSLDSVDEVAPLTRLTVDDIVHRLGATGSSLGTLVPFWPWRGTDHIARGNVNRFEMAGADDVGEQGGSTEQAYAECWWAAEPDQALIYRAEIVPCAYWNLQLSDRWGQSLDYTNRLISWNGHQVTPDDDGTVSIVIDSVDPGTANWMDTAGLDGGILTCRWNQAPRLPQPTIDVVPRADLAQHLAGVARVTPDQRAEQLRSRRAGVLSRYRR